MRMTGYYSRTLHTGNVCDLRERESVKGVTVLQVNRTCARVAHERSECKHSNANVKGEGS